MPKPANRLRSPRAPTATTLAQRAGLVKLPPRARRAPVRKGSRRASVHFGRIDRSGDRLLGWLEVAESEPLRTPAGDCEADLTPRPLSFQ